MIMTMLHNTLSRHFLRKHFVTNSIFAAAGYCELVLFYADRYNTACFLSHIANAPD